MLIIKTQKYTIFDIIRGLYDKITDTPLLYLHLKHNTLFNILILFKNNDIFLKKTCYYHVNYG